MAKFFEKPAWGAIMIIFGMSLLISGSEWYHYLMATIGFATGGHTIYKYYKNKKSHPKSI